MKAGIMSEFGIFGDLPVAHPARSLREEVGGAVAGPSSAVTSGLGRFGVLIFLLPPRQLRPMLVVCSFAWAYFSPSIC